MKLVDINSPKSFIGLEIRTNNKIDTSGQGYIPKIWEKFFKENLCKVINNKVSENIYAFYSNYENNHNGNYDYFLGYEISNPKAYQLFENLILKQLELGKYTIISVAQGTMPDNLIAAWNKIWNMTPFELGGKRAFKTDFEVYVCDSKNPKQYIIDIYLGLNS